MFDSSPTEIINRYASGEREFEGVQLSKVDLSGVDLSHTKLKAADLSLANLNRANLNRANLNRANLNGADLTKAFLIEADLNGAYLNGADLNGAYLTKADLSGTDLCEADLRHDLIAVNLNTVNLNRAQYNNNTRFNAGFDPIKAGMQMVKIPSIDELIGAFNYLHESGSHYLGSGIIAKYWESSRPDFDWLKKFEIHSLWANNFFWLIDRAYNYYTIAVVSQVD